MNITTRGVIKHVYGISRGGTELALYTLTNAHGMSASITNYGGIVTRLCVRDRKGAFANVVLGFSNPKRYEDTSYTGHCPYFGALIGRYANRIACGEFTLEGARYVLAKNDGKNHLHGGLRGFDKVVWKPAILESIDGAALELRYQSRDGEEGYPGTLSVRVVYTVTDADELKIEYEASTDKPTVVNLTHHSYFNLAGEGSGDILGHTLRLEAAQYTPVGADLIPTGELKPVEGTAFDFRTPREIGARMDEVEGGYDHNFVLMKNDGSAAAHAARVSEPVSGRVMDVLTSEPGMQLYTGNFLDGSFAGPRGRAYRKHGGFCLETQHFPDSPNKSGFPSTVLKPGERFTSTTVYRFSVMK